MTRRIGGLLVKMRGVREGSKSSFSWVYGTAIGILSNTVTVSSSVTDPVPGNESATDVSEIQMLPDEIFRNGFEDLE